MLFHFFNGRERVTKFAAGVASISVGTFRFTKHTPLILRRLGTRTWGLLLLCQHFNALSPRRALYYCGVGRVGFKYAGSLLRIEASHDKIGGLSMMVE